MRSLLTAAAFAIVACAGPTQVLKKEPSAPQKPGWLGKLPKRSGYVYVVGVKTRAKSLEEGKAGASQNATVQVSSVVGTKIKSDFEAKSETGKAEYAKEEVDALTQAYIQSLVLEDEYYEKNIKMIGSYYEESYDVWVLGVFPLAAADDERKRQGAEQVEMGRDAFKRYADAQKEKKGGNKREAWVLMAQARKIAKGIPPLTELQGSSYDTAADLLRDIEKNLRGLDELARGVKVQFTAENPPAQKVEADFTSHLSSALTDTSLLLRTNGDARFVLNLKYSGKIPRKQVMGQRVAYITYAGNVDDTWSGNSLPGTSGEVKGFGKTPNAALNEATLEASKKIAEGLDSRLNEVLEKEASGE